MIPSVECVNLDLHDRAEKAEAEVARLREALKAVMEWTYSDDATMSYFYEEVVPLVKDALSTPAERNALAAEAIQEYMATPDDGVEVDAPPMQLRPELQPCGHPVQAIRSTPYIGDQHSNYCGWCADVEHEHELCQSLTAELLAYREKVARLREALKKMLPWAAITIEPDNPRIELTLAADWQSANAALSDTADDWLTGHDAEVIAQAVQDLEDRYRETCHRMYIQGKHEERWRCIAECAEVEDQYGCKNNGAIAARECIAAIREAAAE